MLARENHLSWDNTAPNVAIVCTQCQQKHLKCSGPPMCTRCTRERTLCLFKSSHRGQRKHLPLTVNPTLLDAGPAISSTCVRCRERHLKYSGSPACQRCVNEETSCLFKPSRRGKRRSPAQHAPAVALFPEPVPTSISLEAFTDSTTLRCYKYFQERTLPELCGNLDTAFWNALILRAGYTQPAIRYILTALGSLHESLELAYSEARTDSGDAEQAQVIALKHHRRAIQLLQNIGDHVNIETALVSCILLVCFETLQRDLDSTINLLRGSLNVLAQWRDSAQERDGTIRDEVTPVVSRLTQRLSGYVEAEAAITPSSYARGRHLEHTRLLPRTNIPTRFLDLQQARVCLEDIFSNLWTGVDPGARISDSKRSASFTATTQTLLDSWHMTLNLDRQRHSSVKSQKEIHSMETYYQVASIMNSASHEEGEMRFDKHIGSFEKIVSLSESYLRLDNTNPSLQQAEAIGGIIPALSFCTLRCRCPKLRRKAMDLLNSRCWLEGFCHSLALGAMADCAIKIEESGLLKPETCHDVPQSHRIRFLRTDRLIGVFSPPEYRRPHSCVLSNCSTPHARLDLGFLHRPVRFLLRYVRAPWNSACPIEEILVDLPTCDQANVSQRHRPDGMCLQSMIMNRRAPFAAVHGYKPSMFF